MWEYVELPEALRVPPCPTCTNRGGVHWVARCIYVCTYCAPARVFAAEWREERHVGLAEPPARERVG